MKQSRIAFKRSQRHQRFQIVFWAVIAGALGLATGYWYAASVAAEKMKVFLAQ